MTSTSVQPAPGHPAPAPSIDKVYILAYKKNVTDIRYQHFVFDGPLQGAIERGQEHCKRVNCRFIYVVPFISDLSEIERKVMEYQ